MRPCTPHDRLGCEACAAVIRRIRERAITMRKLLGPDFDPWSTSGVPTPRAEGDE